MLQTEALRTAHVGIAIYEPATNKYWYNHQGNRYFIPASNVKIPTCYAALKYLGDSLVTAYYHQAGNTLFIKPNADPTVMHPDFVQQPLIGLIKQRSVPVIVSINGKDNLKPWGNGWSWNDYDQNYVAERNYFPLYGNRVWLQPAKESRNIVPGNSIDTTILIHNKGLRVSPKYFAPFMQPAGATESFQRSLQQNLFFIDTAGGSITIPFTYASTDPLLPLLRSTTQQVINYGQGGGGRDTILYSQSTTALLQPMMHRSDNFFAEQALLMVSNKVLHRIDDAALIDTILKTDFKDLPQKPRWVDGSGLSRYNLFTPQDFVAILAKMKTAFGMERLQQILPTGNEGTLSRYYQQDSGYIFAKTGTLSGTVAISGFLYTRKNKLLLFSVLVNNHQASATAVRRAVEQFLSNIRRRY